MWSALPDDVVQHLEEAVAEHAPRTLAIFARLNKRCRELAAARLARVKPLLEPPFRLTADDIFRRNLDLHNRKLRAEHVEVLVLALVSGALTSLTTLILYSNAIGDDGMKALADACASGALASLTKLNLEDNEIGDDGVSALAGACANGALPALKELNLNSNQIADAGKSALADALSKGALPNLKELILIENAPALEAACEARGITYH